ncbi:MAG: phosphopantothenoylcysteine decarboxylase [Candidatus Omnitrophica bacterium]|nr:phosphopantothenoylcysteine decarboxylase [Candidatus Omnitrophota bacterium]
MVTKKSILITAGSTWIALDKVRVISNTASGQTGFILADKFKKLGAKITLLLGPGDFYSLKPQGIKIIRFKYFSELERLLKKELEKNKYAAVIHAAAVSDYQPEKEIYHKVSSRLDSWKINLVPTIKLVDNLKNYGPGLISVGFKFEPDAGKSRLIEKGNKLLKQADLDLVVANSNKNKAYQSYILDGKNKYGPFLSKRAMAGSLSKLVEKRL